MQTTHKQVAGRTLLTIQIAPADYMSSFLNDVKKCALQVHAKGFREGSPGHLTLVKKRYGQEILKDILFGKLEEEIDNFLAKEKLLLVGDYSLKEEFKHISTAKPVPLTFEIELIAVPDFELPPFKEIEVKDYEVTSATAEDVDAYIKMDQKLYGKEMLQKTTVSIHDHVTGYFTEKKNNPFTFLVDKPIHEQTSIVGKQKGNIVNFSKAAMVMLPLSVFPRTYKRYNVSANGADHHFVITDIAAKKPCALDQAFFDKRLGAGKVKSLKEFRKIMRKKLLKTTRKDAELLLEINIIKAYQKKLKLEIPHYTGNQAVGKIKSLIVDKMLETNFFQISPTDVFPKLVKLSLLAHINPILPFNEKEVQKVILADVEAALSDPKSHNYQTAYALALVEKSMELIKANIKISKEKISVKSLQDML